MDEMLFFEIWENMEQAWIADLQPFFILLKISSIPISWNKIIFMKQY